jgi:hypothetical protein
MNKSLEYIDLSGQSSLASDFAFKTFSLANTLTEQGLASSSAIMGSVEVKRPIKVASIGGYSGDRLDALASVLTGPIEVDAIVGDFLAEMNLSWRKAEMVNGLGSGADPTFISCLRSASKELKQRLQRGTFPKIVVNAGALSPSHLALEVQAFLASEFGDQVKSLKVAYVTGDDVLDRAQDHDFKQSITHLSGSGSLEEWNFKPTIANVYIGQYGFVRALENGADIVIAGRATDAGSIQALSTWWYGWKEDEYDQHAVSLIAGHLIECGNYVVSQDLRDSSPAAMTENLRQVATSAASRG